MSIGKVQADRSLLKAARVKLGMEQEQLAKAAGVHLNTISNFEKGKSRAARLHTACNPGGARGPRDSVHEWR